MKLETDDFIDDLYRWYKAYTDNIRALSYSKNTLELYSRAISMFIEYSLQYQDEMKLSDIKSLYFTGYLAYLEDEAKNSGKMAKNGNYLSKSTKQTYLKAIKNFFTFINDNNDEFFTFERYFKNIKVADSSKTEEKLIYLTEEEIGRLLEKLEKDKKENDDYNSHRNSLLIKLMLYAGLRISEALNICLDNFTYGQDEEMYNIEIYGKGCKEQIGFIGKKIIDDELEYFNAVAKLKDKDLIMKTTGEKQLNRTNAYQIVNRIYKKVGIKKEGLHLLRHTLAMRLTQRGVNPIVVKKILRHSNIATTTIYAKATEGAVADAMKVDLKEGNNAKNIS